MYVFLLQFYAVILKKHKGSRKETKWEKIETTCLRLLIHLQPFLLELKKLRTINWYGLEFAVLFLAGYKIQLSDKIKNY